jgi:flagellar motility protein MotE (MotC chaperone)
MTTRIASPLSLSLVGLIAGIASGLGWFWLRADCLVEVALARAHSAGKVADKSKGWDFWTIEIDSLASELKDEKARVRNEEEQLDQRTARLASDRQELDKLRTELNAMHKDISDSIVEIQADEAKNLRMLAQTYTNLSPHAAVVIIRELDDPTAVKILSLMKPDVIGPIFEDMTLSASGASDAHRAAVLSEKLRLVKAQKATETP